MLHRQVGVPDPCFERGPRCAAHLDRAHVTISTAESSLPRCLAPIGDGLNVGRQATRTGWAAGGHSSAHAPDGGGRQLRCDASRVPGQHCRPRGRAPPRADGARSSIGSNRCLAPSGIAALQEYSAASGGAPAAEAWAPARHLSRARPHLLQTKISFGGVVCRRRVRRTRRVLRRLTSGSGRQLGPPACQTSPRTRAVGKQALHRLPVARRRKHRRTPHSGSGRPAKRSIAADPGRSSSARWRCHDQTESRRRRCQRAHSGTDIPTSGRRGCATCGSGVGAVARFAPSSWRTSTAVRRRRNRSRPGRPVADREPGGSSWASFQDPGAEGRLRSSTTSPD
jgi:hypothetical protein